MDHAIQAIADEATEALQDNPEVAVAARASFTSTMDLMKGVIADIRRMLDEGYEPMVLAFAIDSWAMSRGVPMGGSVALYLAMQGQVDDVEIPDYAPEDNDE